MPSLKATCAGNSHLKLVFSDKVASFEVAPNATFGEVAQRLRTLSPRRYGDPVAVKLTLVDSTERPVS